MRKEDCWIAKMIRFLKTSLISMWPKRCSLLWCKTVQFWTIWTARVNVQHLWWKNIGFYFWPQFHLFLSVSSPRLTSYVTSHVVGTRSLMCTLTLSHTSLSLSLSLSLSQSYTLSHSINRTLYLTHTHWDTFAITVQRLIEWSAFHCLLGKTKRKRYFFPLTKTFLRPRGAYIIKLFYLDVVPT